MKKQLLFGFYDKITEEYDVLAVCNSCANLIRTYYPAFAQRKPLKDVDIYELGTIDSLNINLHKKPVLHSWTEYQFPETRAEALAPLGLKPDEVEQIFKEKITSDSDKEEKNGQ